MGELGKRECDLFKSSGSILGPVELFFIVVVIAWLYACQNSSNSTLKRDEFYCVYITSQ